MKDWDGIALDYANTVVLGTTEAHVRHQRIEVAKHFAAGARAGAGGGGETLKIGKKSGLRYFSIADVRSWDPCYDPAKYIPEDWRGTAVDVLALEKVPLQDRLWVVLRTELVSERVMRLFAVWCAREALKLIPNPDPRSVAACDVAERFANGQATDEERVAAWVAARDAARDAAWAAAWGAAWAAAGDAAWVAARDAAWAAAGAAAGVAARDAAWVAAWAAAWAAQCRKLAEMVVAEGLERVTAKRGRG